MKVIEITTLLTLALSSVSHGFIFQPSRLRPELSLWSSRREFLAGVVGGSTLVSCVPVALAKEKIPATPENVKKAYDDLRYELNGADGGIARMQSMIDTQNWDGLMEITKSYDQELRKGKVGRAKSFLPDKEQTVMTMTANAITFDLIGINRNARPGQENVAEANRYLDELRTDLQLVIDEEKYVVYEA